MLPGKTTFGIPTFSFEGIVGHFRKFLAQVYLFVKRERWRPTSLLKRWRFIRDGWYIVYVENRLPGDNVGDKREKSCFCVSKWLAFISSVFLYVGRF